jgi:hypothetical protein
MPFVTPTEASHNWRAGIVYGDSPETSEDTRAPRLEQCLSQAESTILNYLKVTDDSPAWEPEDKDLDNLKAAILLIGKALYDGDHEGQALMMRDAPGQEGIIPLLLRRMRNPAYA